MLWDIGGFTILGYLQTAALEVVLVTVAVGHCCQKTALRVVDAACGERCLQTRPLEASPIIISNVIKCTHSAHETEFSSCKKLERILKMLLLKLFGYN